MNLVRKLGEKGEGELGGVMDFSSLVRTLGECSTIHFSPALFFFFFENEN